MAGVFGPEALPPAFSIVRGRVLGHDRSVSTSERNGTPRSGCLKASTENVQDGTNEMAERVGFEPTVPVLAAHTISSRVPSANSDISPRIERFATHVPPPQRGIGRSHHPAAA